MYSWQGISPQNPPVCQFYVVQKRRSADIKALKLWKVLSSCGIDTLIKQAVSPISRPYFERPFKAGKSVGKFAGKCFSEDAFQGNRRERRRSCWESHPCSRLIFSWLFLKELIAKVCFVNKYYILVHHWEHDGFETKQNNLIEKITIGSPTRFSFVLQKFLLSDSISIHRCT